ncbi:MAG: type II toxin-antitoxin system VapC family toxin [Vicinamibacterales bacterium]
MNTYADSSALVALYVTEPFSDAADAALRAAGQIPFNLIHQLEVPNAFERLVGRKLLTREECRGLYDHLQEDLDHRRLVATAVDLDAVFAQATELSTAHAARFLARSLDLLHVAAAHVSGCTRFVSADDRQIAVAKTTGLTVIDIKRRARRTRRQR